MNDADLVRLIDSLEDRVTSHLTLDDVATVVDCQTIDRAISDHVLLVDYRTRVDGTPVTLCRLNRRHPLVAELTRW